MKCFSPRYQAALLLATQGTVHSFAPTPTQTFDVIKRNSLVKNDINVLHENSHSPSLVLNMKTANGGSEEEEGGFLSNLKINPPYAIAYASFIAIATYMNSVEPAGASQALIDKFITDPINPGVNELFTSEFNLLGLIGLPMACLVMPGAKGQSLPAPPFLFGSSLAGYGSLGIYMSTRKSPTSGKAVELGPITKNVLENKIFNWFVVALGISTFFVTGAVPALMNDPQQLLSGYVDVVTSSALGFVSTVDLAILCATAASLIPEDLERRGMTDSNKANAIAVSTLLLPVVGPTLYCALRPSLPEE